MKKFLSLFFCVFAWSLLTHAEAPIPQGQESYGGSGTVGEFRLIASDFQRLLKYMNPQVLPSSTFVSDFILKSQVVEVLGAERVYLDGVEVDAKNSPYKTVPTIEVSISRWSTLTSFAKYHLVLHEMLPILGFIDDHYRYSIPIMGTLVKGGLKDFSVIEIAQGSFKTCDKDGVSRSTFILMTYRLKSEDTEGLKALFKLALSADCGLAVRYLMDFGFQPQDLKYDGTYYLWIVIQEILRARPESVESKMAFLKTLIELRFPVNETSDAPEISSVPVTLFHLLAQIQNPLLFERTADVFKILADSYETPLITPVDLEKARLNKNDKLSALFQKFLP